MKIKAVATYQSVKFNGKQELYFTKAKPGMSEIELEYDPKGNYVRISSPQDDILVFATNIAFAVVDSEVTKAKDITAEPKLRDIKPRG